MRVKGTEQMFTIKKKLGDIQLVNL